MQREGETCTLYRDFLQVFTVAAHGFMPESCTLLTPPLLITDL